MKLSQTDIDRALVYMGSGGRDTSSLMPLVKECSDRLSEAVSPLYIYRLFPLLRTRRGLEVCGTELILTGNSISEHLEGCGSCILLCATLSSGADKVIRQLEAYDMAAAFVTDCLASSAVESVCDRAEAEIRERLPRKWLTWRYSPGYGDLPLGLQRTFLNVLDAQKRIGLNVTDSDMLVPSKSVTAVIGVSDSEIVRSRRGCTGCNMYENCKFRKGGDHCGAQSFT